MIRHKWLALVLTCLLLAGAPGCSPAGQQAASAPAPAAPAGQTAPAPEAPASPTPVPAPERPVQADPASGPPAPRVVRTPEGARLINPPQGYAIALPPGAAVDLRLAPAFVRVTAPDLDVKISRERSPYDDVDSYFRDYLNRFVANPDYRAANQIALVDDTWQSIGDRRTRIVSAARTRAPGSPESQTQYLFAYMLTGGREFYSFLFRTGSLEAQRPAIDAMLRSFTPVPVRGESTYATDFHPVPGEWNEETRDAYARLKNSSQIQWGFFSPWALTRDYARVAEVEAQLNFHFPILLHYLYADHAFPAEGMEDAYRRGQLVELTMQVAAGNNDNAPTHNANFDLLDGKYDGQLRAFARAARAFRHPFLFRLNNEMNTDWSQYSGILLLSDPDAYIKVWQRVYRIFREEGVDNAIWIFNPNGQSYPPVHWNAHTAYYPGNDYVHLIGLTGYNTGDYFREVTGEHWRSFDEIYAPLAAEYRQVYSRFPWMITEFASSSVGGDKAEWIRHMFRSLPKYPEIKAAVWWSYADFDYREGKTDIPARRYWLDEKPEYLDAFREGLAQQGP